MEPKMMSGTTEYLITRYEQRSKIPFVGDKRQVEKMVVELLNVCTMAELVNAVKTSETELMETLEELSVRFGMVFDGVDKVRDGEIRHEKFGLIRQFVENGIPVFMTGEAGTGKSIICSQIAEDLGLKFYFANAVTQEYKLTGYSDANGNYHRTPFRDAFETGGVFMLDEMDASIPEVLVILNEAIANGRFPFPDGMVYAHKDFRIISAGNTYGHGASHVYVGRYQLDGASLDRFALVEVSYDTNIEYRLSGHCDVIVGFVRHFRDAVAQCGIQHIVSYRAIGRMGKMIDVIPDKILLKTCLFKNLDEDDMERIKPIMIQLNGGNLRGRFYDCL